VWYYDVGKAPTGSGQHARLLDAAVKDVDSEFVLTMDSDCFPVADGWLKTLVDMQKEDVVVSGILWPWVPPPESLSHKTIEWRIRRQHCWNNTQIACQLIPRSFLDAWKFGDARGDDTNFYLMDCVREAGMRVAGLMPTRCPKPDRESFDFDPEMNRHESIIFGDLVYHHVGATRESRKEVVGKEAIFKESRQRVYNEQGAEWMLALGQSYPYHMDREEDVAQFKMQMMYRDAAWFLESHSSLFGGGWV
jgi:hypothetical protein